ncbi:MAG TPA: ABC transporter permease [Candidatus Limnocylindrales bacterium]
MRGLSSFAWRSLRARRARTILTLTGIALGVGILFAALATNASIDRSVDRTVLEAIGRADLRIAAFQETGLSDATLTAVRDTPGVAQATGQIERRTYLQATLGSGPRPPVTLLAVDPSLDRTVHDRQGLPDLSSDGEVLVSEDLAREDGLAVGSTIVVQGAAADVTVTVRGVLPGNGPIFDGDGRAAVVTLQAARAAFGPIGLSRIDLTVGPGVTPAAVTQELERRLGLEPYLLFTPADLAASLRSSTADFQATTALIAAVTLFGGAFLIFNTLSMSVTELFREVGLLRAAGTTRRQVHRLVLTQAVTLGALGSAGGIVLGWLLAALMAGYVRSVAGVPVEAVEVPLAAVVLAIAIGVLVTVAAALEPAWRAGRISPIDALRSRPEQGPAIRARLRWLAVVFAVIAVAGLLAWPSRVGDPALVRALLVYGLLLACTIASPFVLGPLGRLAGLPFSVLLVPEERLARGALTRDRGRTALTVGALMVGVAMIVALAGVAQNARQAAAAWVTDVIPGDEILTAINPVPVDGATAVPEDLFVPGVVRVTPIATFAVAYQGVRLDAAATIGADMLADGRLRFVEGDRTAALTGLDAGGTILLPRSVAERLGLHLGSAMAFQGAGGKPIELRIAGIIERGLPGSSGEALVIGWPDASASLGVVGADFFAARFAPGETGAAARPRLEAAARQLALEPAPLDRVQGAVSSALGQVFGLFDALAVVAVIVAGLGIVNTLTMNVLERVREIGVLRAIGMTRRQVWRMVVVEAGVLGLVGAIIGCVVGLAAGFLMLGLVAAGGLGVAVQVPWLTLVLAAVFATAVAMLAAFQPARIASRISIVRAVQYE